MSLSQIISTPCTLVLASQADTEENAYGDDVPGDAPEVETVCSLQQVSRNEPEAEGEISDTKWRIFFLPDVDAFTTQDQVVVGDQTFEFDGDPWKVDNPWRGESSHVEASVRLIA